MVNFNSFKDYHYLSISGEIDIEIEIKAYIAIIKTVIKS